MSTAIELKDVFRVHSTPEGDAAALQGLSLRVAEGEVVTVLGPSGSGKSTLLRLLAGLERPSAGQVKVHGDDLAKLPARQLARYRSSLLGYADQHYGRALAPELTARELVAVQLGLRGTPRPERARRADELLERVGLAGKRDRRPGELSGGEQQRVALCAALAHRPRVFLADEPTGELDSRTADQVYDVLAELVREHRCTTVIVSHDPESTRIADRIVRIRDGRVSEEWSRDGAESDDPATAPAKPTPSLLGGSVEPTPLIVVGRGGWLRLPEELLLRAGIGSHATATFENGTLVVVPAAGREVAQPLSDTVVSDATGGTHRVAEAHGLEKRYGSTVVLDGLAASFDTGRLHAVVGPSGSGKTTLLHLLAGLELPDAGTITVAGTELTALDRTARAALRRAKIAYVGQQAGLVPHLSALENVELTLSLRGLEDGSRLAALGALESVGLGERATQHVSRLSQGERARVAIARAVASKPALLLADEPTSRLDGANAIAVAVLLARLARDTGAAVVCSTHDPLVIEQADAQITL
jgi:ABC-type lipoprotein export system ATPase subunit